MSTGTQIALGVGIALVIFVSVLALRRREPSRAVTEISPEALAQAKSLVAGGKKIQAVKVIRDETGWQLKRRKDIVDRMRLEPGRNR
jgi:hypothetical protein